MTCSVFTVKQEMAAVKDVRTVTTTKKQPDKAVLNNQLDLLKAAFCHLAMFVGYFPCICWAFKKC